MNIKPRLRAATVMIALVAGLAGITAAPAQAAECCWRTAKSVYYNTQAECEEARVAFAGDSGYVVSYRCSQHPTTLKWYFTYRYFVPND